LAQRSLKIDQITVLSYNVSLFSLGYKTDIRFHWYAVCLSQLSCFGC